MDSDLLGQGMCSRWRKGEAPAGDFQWASHFKVVPQQVGKTDQKRAQRVVMNGREFGFNWEVKSCKIARDLLRQSLWLALKCHYPLLLSDLITALKPYCCRRMVEEVWFVGRAMPKNSHDSFLISLSCLPRRVVDFK